MKGASCCASCCAPAAVKPLNVAVRVRAALSTMISTKYTLSDVSCTGETSNQPIQQAHQPAPAMRMNGEEGEDSEDSARRVPEFHALHTHALHTHARTLE